MIHIGIDVGTNTGIAVWIPKTHEGAHAYAQGAFATITSGTIWQAVDLIHLWQPQGIHLHIEDARLAKFWNDKDTKRLMGAGSVRGASKIWEEFAQHYGYPYTLHRPKMGTKIDALTFKRLTGWQWRTNSHARDAAMIVFNLK